MQVPEGVDFDGNTAYLVFGIAGKNNEHLEILGQIATICSEMENVEILRQATSKAKILKILRRSSFNETGIAFWRWKYWDRLYC